MKTNSHRSIENFLCIPSEKKFQSFAHNATDSNIWTDSLKEIGIFFHVESGLQLLNALRSHEIELEMLNGELRQKQMELESSYTYYYDMYDQAPVGYIILNNNNQIKEVNNTAADLLGASKNELVDNFFSGFIHSLDLDAYFQHYTQLFKTEIPQVFDVKLQKKDLTYRWVNIHAIVYIDTFGETLCRAVLSDITHLKQNEHKPEKHAAGFP